MPLCLGVAFGIGLAQQRDQPRSPRVGDPRLGAVDHQVVTVGARDGGHGLQIRAAARFGQRHGGPHFAGRHPRQVRRFCSSVPNSVSSLATTVCPPIAPARLIQPRASSCVTSDVARHRHRGAAVFLGDRQPVDPDPLHLLDPRLGVFVGVLDLAHRRLDLPVDERPHRLDQ